MNFERATIKILEGLFKKGDKFTKKEDLLNMRLVKNNFEEILNFLNHKKLIVGDKQGAEWRINPDGIEYLNNYKIQQRQEEFNKIVALTGTILALIGIYQFLKDLNLIRIENYWITSIFIIIVIAVLAPLIGFVFKSIYGGFE